MRSLDALQRSLPPFTTQVPDFDRAGISSEDSLQLRLCHPCVKQALCRQIGPSGPLSILCVTTRNEGLSCWKVTGGGDRIRTDAWRFCRPLHRSALLFRVGHCWLLSKTFRHLTHSL